MYAGLLSLKLAVAFLTGFLSATFLHVWFIWPHPQRFGSWARTEWECHYASHGVILVPRIPTTSSLVMWLNWQKWNWGVILLLHLGVQHGFTGWSEEGKPAGFCWAEQSHAKSMQIEWSTGYNIFARVFLPVLCKKLSTEGRYQCVFMMQVLFLKMCEIFDRIF